MQLRKIAVISLFSLALSGITGSIYANDKKPVKENPAAASNNSGGNANKGSGDSNSNSNAASNKLQEPVPAPTPTSQPIESVSTTNVISAEPINTSSNNQNKPDPKPENTAKPDSKPETKPEPSNKPENSAKPENNGKPEVVTESTAATNSNSNKPTTSPEKPKSLNTAANSKAVVVKESAFKNTKLVAGKLAAGKVNAAAKNIEKKAADEECGVEEKSANLTTASASKSTGKSNAAAAKKSSTSTANEKASANKPDNKSENKPQNKPKEECKDYILVFSDDSDGGDIDSAAKEAKGKVLQKFNKVFKGALVNGPPSKIEALAKNPKVQSIELDGTVTKQDIYSNAVWGLDRIDQRNLPLNASYDDLGNSGYTIPVYVVDTGIYAEHSEFVGRVAPGATSITDGYGTFDCNGHGTHVAGTIAGAKFGIAKTATLIPVRVLDCSGSGSYSGVIAGLDWIATNHPSGVPAVVNMSLGGPASSSLDTAVNNLISRGITVVVAAGNSGADACNYSPSRVPAAITVAATAIDDARASYSNYGSCVDVFAPGSSITSAWISGTTGSAVLSGTSMASPHVAGAIARFLYTNPTSSPFQSANSTVKSATLDLIANVGPGTPNRLLFFDIAFDPTTAPSTTTPTTTKPSNPKKTTNPGKGNKG